MVPSTEQQTHSPNKWTVENVCAELCARIAIDTKKVKEQKPNTNWNLGSELLKILLFSNQNAAKAIMNSIPESGI